MTRIIFPALFVTIAAACSGSQTHPDGPTGGDGSSGPSTTSTTGSTEPPLGETSSTTGGGVDGAGGAGGASSGSGATAPVTQAQMVAAGDAARGAKLYEENHCIGCHGTHEKPGKKFPNLFKVDWNQDKEIAEAFELIKKGKTPMPGFEDKLDDKAIADVVAYLKSAK